MKAKTNRNMKAAPPVGFSSASDWWHPQLETSIGRVELGFCANGYICVRRAGWLKLKSGRRLSQHHDSIDLERDSATGRWRPEADAYRNAHDRKTAEAIGEAVTAWAANNDDMLRRCSAFEQEWMGMMGPAMALRERAHRLSAEIEAGLFDFDDAGHARAIATRAAERMRQMMAEVDAMRDEIRQAITPTTDKAVAA